MGRNGERDWEFWDGIGWRKEAEETEAANMIGESKCFRCPGLI